MTEGAQRSLVREDPVPYRGPALVCKASTAEIVKGRRDFADFLDYGVTDATNGAVRAQVIKMKGPLPAPTGWHYHICDYQLLYRISGWSDLALEDGVHRIEAGDFILIPGGVRHNELMSSGDAQMLEISFPSDMGTVACAAPVPDTSSGS